MIAWIPSYPKSGNTWVRAFLSTYLFSPDGFFNIKFLHKIREFPDHNILGKFMDKKNFHNLGEVSKHWKKVQEFINLKEEYSLLKTHNALCNINGNSFTDSKCSRLFIYIVRDPRNVVLSISNHFGISQEESFQIMTNERYIIYSGIGNEILPATFVGSWNKHYQSWKNCNSINKIIIKYEDLISNEKKTFKTILNFLIKNTKVKFDEKKFMNSLISTNFENLKKYEENHGFNMGQKNKFFNMGRKSDWKSLLNVKICNEISSKFKLEMEELGYI
jgi:hypothetical protein